MADTLRMIQKAGKRDDVPELVRLGWAFPQESTAIDLALSDVVQRLGPAATAEQLVQVFRLPERSPEWHAVQVVSSRLIELGPARAELVRWAGDRSQDAGKGRAALVLDAVGHHEAARELLASVTPAGVSGPERPAAEVSGIGGWLVVFLIPLVAIPLGNLAAMAASVVPALTLAGWSPPGSWFGDGSGSTALVALEWICVVVLLLAGPALLYLALGKRSIFRWLVLGYYPLAAVESVPRYLARPGAHTVTWIVTAIFCAVWVLYYVLSKRVRRTFKL